MGLSHLNCIICVCGWILVTAWISQASIHIKKELVPCSDQRNNKEHLTKCDKKITISLKIKNQNKTVVRPQYIIINSVYDKVMQESVALFNPLVIDLRQHQVTILYPFSHRFSVNSRPYELILQKDNARFYQGCETSNHYISACIQPGEEPIQENAQGFCCSCDDAEDSESTHPRGGQDCTDKQLPPPLRTSAHCLKFDPLWYSVNYLGQPSLWHELDIDVYMEMDRANQSRTWQSMGNITLGTDTQQATSKRKHSVLGTYSDVSFGISKAPLDYRRHRLLIPEPVSTEDPNRIPTQLKTSASKYLVVDEDSIDTSGSECNKIGVSHAAFLNQANQCGKMPQSCLSNQPWHLWIQDEEASVDNRTTHHFLSSYSSHANPSIVHREDDKGQNKRLMLDYMPEFVSRISLEINADQLLFLYKGHQAVIEAVTVNSHADNIEILVHVSNTGLVSAEFGVRLSECDPAIHSPGRHVTIIGPHQSRKFVFTLSTQGLRDKDGTAVCLVELLNDMSKKVAARQVKFKALDKCFCMAHCQCKCMRDIDLGCTQLSQAEYQKTGFQGPVPKNPIVHLIPTTTINSIAVVLLIVFLAIFIGLVKLLVGVMLDLRVSHSGLWLFWDDHLQCYYEDELKGYKVIYNGQEMPVHPEQGCRVRQMPRWKEVLLNLLIVWYLLILPLHWLVLKGCTRSTCGWPCHLCNRNRASGEPHYTPVPTKDTEMESVNSESIEFESRVRRRSLQEILEETESVESDYETLNKRPHSLPSTPERLNKAIIMEQYRKRKSYLSSTSKKQDSTVTESKHSNIPDVENRSTSVSGLDTSVSLVESDDHVYEAIPLNDMDEVDGILNESVHAGTTTTTKSDAHLPHQILHHPTSAEIETKKEAAEVPMDQEDSSIQDTNLLASRAEIATQTGDDLFPIEDGHLAESLELTDQDSDILAQLCHPGALVYYNFTSSNSHLWRSGDRFSLCGHLRHLSGEEYKFTLGPHLTQLFENVNGEARVLLTPLPINSKYFQENMDVTDVLQYLSRKQLYPCLNYVPEL